MAAVEKSNLETSLNATEEEIEYVCPSCGFSLAAASGAKILCRTKNCNVLVVPVRESVTFSE